MDVDEYISRQDRFLELSPVVWQAFASGIQAPSPELRENLSEYLKHFLAITKAEVAPFYAAASPEFFDWLHTAVTGRR